MLGIFGIDFEGTLLLSSYMYVHPEMRYFATIKEDNNSSRLSPTKNHIFFGLLSNVLRGLNHYPSTAVDTASNHEKIKVFGEYHVE